MTTLLLTIIGPEHSVDVAVPGDLPLSKLITPLLETEFVDLVGSPPRAWVLALPDGEPLEPERSLIECGVADGHVLRLRPASDRASEALAGHAANIDTLSAADAGGVPSASALRHAAVFGMTDVVDALAAAGARVRSLPRPPPSVRSARGRPPTRRRTSVSAR